MRPLSANAARSLFFAITLCWFPPQAHAGILFVKADATGANDGTSWNDAYVSLQSALAGAVSNDEIWVSASAYFPTTGVDQTATFQLLNNVALYGGFNGTETLREQRDWTTSITILSGAIGNPTTDDNSYHVVTGSGTDATAIIDGFTIRHGAANDPNTFANEFGGGMVLENGSPTIANMIFDGNFALFSGGGLRHVGGNNPTLTNVVFSNNVAGGVAGGITFIGKAAAISSNGGSITLTDVTVTGSDVPTSGGVAMELAGTATITDCVFENNLTGGLKLKIGASATVTGCTFANNAGVGVQAIALTNVTLTNSVIEGNGNTGAWLTGGTIENVIFRNNVGSAGGGLFAFGGVVVKNSLFMNNRAGRGGGVYLHSGGATLTNVSFFGNMATIEGDAVYAADNGLELFNAILWGNGAAPVAFDTDAFVTFTSSLVEGSGGSGAWNASFGIDGGNNIDADPFYVDSSAENLHLSAGSPAHNAGDNAAPFLPATDFDGKPRILDGVVDMGAYEFTCTPGNRLYVDAAATGAGNGSSWSDAFSTLSQALAAACSNITEVWVTGGTYTPTQSMDRSRTFKLRSGLAVYGGFSGTETLISQRDPSATPTFLSGEIGAPTETDNSYHVVTGGGTDASAVIDGFTVTGGNAAGVFPDNSGAGMSNMAGSPSVRNVTFMNNTALGNGGGMYNHIGSHPELTNVVFRGNSVAASGGGMHNLLSNPSITNGVFINNSAVGTGGGVHNAASNPTLTNVTFNGNSAVGGGGGMYSSGGSPLIVNTILWGDAGGEIVNVSSSPLTSFSLVQGSGGSGNWDPAFGTDGGNNIDTDPLFVDALAGDLTLSTVSPAINSGDNTAPNLPPTDIAGNPRIIGVAVDMGAFEAAFATAIGDQDTPQLPNRPGLGPAYPNPFNPHVTIAYELDRARTVDVSIFDTLGRLVRRLLHGHRGAGLHRVPWDGTDSRGQRVASGVYLVRFESDGWRDQRKITLLK